jgi:Domain of unknown function (DUF4412)
MKQVVTAFLGLAILTGVAHAGVVVEEQQVVDRGVGTPTTNKITVMVQGNKQKYVIGDGKQESITDLDQGTRAMVSNARKMYVVLPFPPKGMTMPPNAKKSALAFAKTGGHETIAGYHCDDYTGTGSMGENEMTVNGCFSTSAPGAANFTAFQKTMSEKVKDTPMALMSDTPAGIPLKIDTSLKQKTAGGRQPIVTHMTVTKVTEQDLPSDTFQPPKDYTKQQMPMMGMMPPGMMGKPAPGANAPAGAPAANPPTAPNKVQVPE